MPPRVFSQKSLQAIENKGRECEKERKERQRGGKLLKTWDLPPRPSLGREEHRVHCDGSTQDTENWTWLVNNNPSLLLVLHKWMILKGVEVVCFDTLLQVLMALLTSPTQFLFRGSTRRGLRCFLMEQEGQWPKSDSCPLFAWRWKWPRRFCLLTARASANISSPSRSCWPWCT